MSGGKLLDQPSYIHINTYMYIYIYIYIHHRRKILKRKPQTVDLFHLVLLYDNYQSVHVPEVSNKVTCNFKVKVAKVYRRYQCNEIHRLKHNNLSSFKILVVLLLKSKFFWDVIPCRMVKS
jgi:hypothetical protein